MHRAYHKLQKWDKWLEEFFGKQLLAYEKNVIDKNWSLFNQDNVALIGVSKQSELLSSLTSAGKYIASPYILSNQKVGAQVIEADFYKLPFCSGSLDLVIVPHTLDMVDNPHHFLSEACRIIKPEGYICIFNFNVFSPWGFYKLFLNKNDFFAQKFLTQKTIVKWLKLNDFALTSSTTLMIRPPMNHKIYEHLSILEKITKFFPLGGVNAIVAQAKSIPVTPIRLKWKQTFTGVIPSIQFGKPTVRTKS